MIRTNRRVTIKRPASSPTGFSGENTLQVIHSDTRAWVRLSNSIIVTIDGSQVSSEGEMRIRKQVQEGDVMQFLDDTRRYRMEGVEEILSPVGRVIAYKAFLVRDTAQEG